MKDDLDMFDQAVDDNLVTTLFHAGVVAGTIFVFAGLAVGVHLVNALIQLSKKDK